MPKFQSPANIKYSIITIISVFIFSSKTQAQAILKGKLNDSLDIGSIQNASILLLTVKDSILLSSTRSNANGEFQLPLKDTGSFLVLITYPNYADFIQYIWSKGESINLPTIELLPKARLLADVTVRQKMAAVRLKGDTTEFVADSFHVQANASVEDLLKKMPSIQIDKNGKITAYGEAIKKVLVDGEEFFGDDPTLITQNLRADMVDKVQLYDKKSDQAIFTGIDDGIKDKTLNIKLKEDKKKGYFGKLSAGAGTNGMHENTLMANKFSGKEKIAAYGMVGNTGKVGLSWDDADQYGGNSGTTEVQDDGSTITYFGGGDDGWDGNYGGNGTPLSQTAGLHYNNKWNDNKTSLNGNYKINNLIVNGYSSTNTQNNLPTTINYSTNTNSFRNRSLRNKLDATFDMDIDSATSLRVVSSGNFKHLNTYDQSNTLTQRENLTKLNAGINTNTQIGDNNQFKFNALLKHKLKKQGRTITFTIDYNNTKNNTNGYVLSTNEFYNTQEDLDSSIIVNQYKTNQGTNSLLNTRLTYTEPLSKTSSLIFNYGFGINNSNANKISYNQNQETNIYDQFDSIYSNHYIYNQIIHRGGAFYNFKLKKIQFSVGTNVLGIAFKQKNELFHTDSSDRERRFVNWNPTANFTYAFSNQRRLRFNYYGRTTQPTMDELQPILTNNDPLNVYIGNSQLKPSFSSSFSLSYSDYKMLTEQSLYFGLYANTTNNAITTNTRTDTSGKNTYLYTNINGNYNFSLYSGINFKSKNIKNLRYGFSPRAYMSRSANITNDVLNISKSNNYSLGFSISKSKDSLYDISLNTTPGYTFNRFSIQSTNNNNYWTLSVNPNIDFFLPLKFQIHTDLDYNWQQRTKTLQSTSVALLNGWIGKKFLKKENLLLKLYGFDLLNQNRGISRYQNNNAITQSINSTIRRYFLLSLTWNFTGGMMNAK